MSDKRPAWLKRMDPSNLLAPPKPPVCDCRVCAPNYEYFRVCSDCGNKRCPRATFHEHGCSRSNTAGQIGSSYGAVLCGKAKCKCIKLHEQIEKDRKEWADWRRP